MQKRPIHLAARLLALGAAALISAAPAQAALIADVVFVIDTSGSMGGDIDQVKSRIVEFNTAMTTAGIDVQYGLVRYGGAPSLIQDITSFGTFNAAGSPFVLLTANGGATEDGSAALETALTASFRSNTVRNFILITDEDDDNVANRATLNAALAATAANELINIIGNPGDDSNGYYQALAPAHGGAFFDILSFRSDPATFFTSFINTKVQEIINQPPGGTVPEPGSLLLAGSALLGLLASRRRLKA